MHFQFFSEHIPYTGKELCPHWISARTQRFDDAIIAFLGPCAVESAELVDLEDKRAKSRIQAAEMLHFLGEFFQQDLTLGIAIQRLLIAAAADVLREQLPLTALAGIRREGNDLFFHSGKQERRKLSVGIVTASPVSTLFHFAINVDPAGAPVAAVGLKELGVDANTFAKAVLQRWESELFSLHKARCKVLPR